MFSKLISLGLDGELDVVSQLRLPGLVVEVGEVEHDVADDVGALDVAEGLLFL